MTTLEHNKKLCSHKIFYGMKDGHCIKCGDAFKNCDICFPEIKGEILDLYRVNFAWTNFGNGIFCAWCGKKINEIKDPNDHVEAHDHTQKQVASDIKNKILGAIMAVGFSGGFTNATDGAILSESVDEILGQYL